MVESTSFSESARTVGTDTDLVARIQEFVTSGTGDFDALALEAFAFQYERIEPYRRLCDGRGVRPGDADSWREIPQIPASAFKTLALHAAPPQIAFKTSGTTRGEEQRGAHHHPFLDLYRAVIDTSFPRYCLPGLGKLPMLSLIPSSEQVPESSLSFMIDRVLERFGDEASAAVFGRSRVEMPRARSWLGARQRDGRPGLVLGTGLALIQLLDGLERMGLRFRLPSGSALFETGGLKGKTQEVDRGELLARVQTHLGIPAQRVVSEYGMTELTGQCYTRSLLEPLDDGGDPTAFVAPPWMRVRILDPETLEEVPEGEGKGVGEVGLISIFDLANVGSAVHLLTEDLGRPVPGGGFHLVGRAAGSELRGCSLTVEEMADR